MRYVFIDRFSAVSIRRKLVLAFLAVALVPLTILGVFSLVNVFQSSSQAALSIVDAKLRIAQLVWGVRSESLASSSRAISQDNLVILNMDLGLTQPFSDYLKDKRREGDLSLALLLNPAGELIASAGQDYVPSGLKPIPLAALSAAARTPQMLAIHLTDEAFLRAENLAFAPGHSRLALVAVQAIYNYGQLLTGYAVCAMAFGLPGDAGSAGFFRTLEQEVGMPVLLTENAALIHANETLAGLDLPSGLDRAGSRVGWDSGLQNMGGLNNRFLTRFVTVALVQSIEQSASFGGICLGVAYPEIDFLGNRNLTVFVLFAMLTLALAASAVLGLSLSRSISGPIVAVSEGAREIVNGNFTVRIRVSAKDEVGLMAEEFNVMTSKLSESMQRLAREVEEHQEAERLVRRLNDELEERVNVRTRELTNANEALAESLALLRRTQKHLVETEKLAALGNLVAGIAHELNTPIGVSMTAASFLMTKTKELEKQIGANELTRHALSDFIGEVHEVSQLLATNLGRSAEQIRFFKQIAVDQETGGSGELNLHDYIDELNISLVHHLRKDGHRFVNDIPPDLTVHTWPGPLYQVISNLVMNSLHHGFHQREGGTISYQAHAEGERLYLEYRDDGAGIAADVLHRIFDPFFTTKRGTGRTGLGLSIVFNLVTVKLGGEISCASTEGQGVLFRIVMPLGEPLEQLATAESPDAPDGDA